METIIDARGLDCPAPVLETKRAIEDGNPVQLTVSVDNDAARENVTRFMESRNYTVTFKNQDGVFIVTGSRGEQVETPDVIDDPADDAEEHKIMIMISDQNMGSGDDALGSKLMVSFLSTLKEMGSDLWRLVFVNGGVKLTVDGSPVVESLKGLEAEGVHILVCGTCLTHFGILDRKQVGETTNMLDIVTAMQLADKVVNI